MSIFHKLPTEGKEQMEKEKQSSKLNLLQLAYLGTPFSAVAASRCSERRVGLEG